MNKVKFLIRKHYRTFFVSYFMKSIIYRFYKRIRYTLLDFVQITEGIYHIEFQYNLDGFFYYVIRAFGIRKYMIRVAVSEMHKTNSKKGVLYVHKKSHKVNCPNAMNVIFWWTLFPLHNKNDNLPELSFIKLKKSDYKKIDDVFKVNGVRKFKSNI